MPSDQETRKVVFKAAVKHSRLNNSTGKATISDVLFFLSSAEAQAKRHGKFRLALCFRQVYLVVKHSNTLNSAWIELEQVGEIQVGSEPSTPASNTGVTDTAAQLLIDYVAGVKS